MSWRVGADEKQAPAVGPYQRARPEVWSNNSGRVRPQSRTLVKLVWGGVLSVGLPDAERER